MPGAAFLDVDDDLASAPGEGRHPLPPAAAFERSVALAGIEPDSLVVAYDEAGEGGAARLWWLLRHFGHDEAVVLDGGMRAWRAAGAPLRPAVESIAVGAFRATARAHDTIDADALRGRLGEPGLVLVDARTPERYRGDVEPIDARAGHLPGAHNAPHGQLAPEGRYRPPDELRARLEAAGASDRTTLVAYCGSGITACTVLLAAEIAGLERALLYPGSWSDWSSRGNPIETG